MFFLLMWGNTAGYYINLGNYDIPALVYYQLIKK